MSNSAKPRYYVPNMEKRKSTAKDTAPASRPYLQPYPPEGLPPDTSPFSVPMGVPLYPLYGYDNVEDLDKDYRYMQQLYPGTARTIQNEVAKECEKLDYDGSFIFDEYPDKASLNKIIDSVYEKVQDTSDDVKVETKSISYYPRQSRNYLRDLVTIVLLNEIFNRRRRQRSRRRWY